MDLCHARDLERIFLRGRGVECEEVLSDRPEGEEDGHADGDGVSSWRSCRVGRAAQNDRARSTGSICGSQAEESQPGPKQEMQQEDEWRHKIGSDLLTDTSRYGTSRLATLQTTSLPLAVCIRCITKFGLGDPLELQPDFKPLSVSFSPIWLEDDNRFCFLVVRLDIGEISKMKADPPRPVTFPYERIARASTD